MDQLREKRNRNVIILLNDDLKDVKNGKDTIDINGQQRKDNGFQSLIDCQQGNDALLCLKNDFDTYQQVHNNVKIIISIGALHRVSLNILWNVHQHGPTYL